MRVRARISKARASAQVTPLSGGRTYVRTYVRARVTTRTCARRAGAAQARARGGATTVRPRTVIIACQRHVYALWYFDASTWECNQLGQVLCSLQCTGHCSQQRSDVV